MGLHFKKGCNIIRFLMQNYVMKSPKNWLNTWKSNLIQGKQDNKQENQQGECTSLNELTSNHHELTSSTFWKFKYHSYWDSGSKLQHYWAVTSMLWTLKQLCFFFLLTYVVLFISITYEQWTCSPNDEHFYWWIISTHRFPSQKMFVRSSQHAKVGPFRWSDCWMTGWLLMEEQRWQGESTRVA